MVIGKCPLCRGEKELVRSHFIPAAIYKSLRARNFPNSAPMIVTPKLATQSAVQITAHVFCFDCEQRFSREGETWAVNKLATLDGFPLRDLMLAASPIEAQLEVTTYSCALIPSFKVAKLTHFAMGVFWKASVYPWRVFGKPIEKLSFGPYADEIRTFLSGGVPFPKDMSLSVFVDPSPKPFVAFHLPRGKKWEQGHMFQWYVNGVEFALNVGKQIPDEFKGCCIYSAPDNPIFLDNTLPERVKGRLVNTSLNKRISRNVLSTYEHYKKLRNR